MLMIVAKKNKSKCTRIWDND